PCKHVVDCLEPLRFLPATGPVVDVGSGAGFPGIVLASVRPEMRMVLIESRRRPVTFLRECSRKLPLPNLRVIEARAEDAAQDPALADRSPLVTCRGLRLDQLLPLAVPLLAPRGVVLAMQTPRTAAAAPGLAANLGLKMTLEHH